IGDRVIAASGDLRFQFSTNCGSTGITNPARYSILSKSTERCHLDRSAAGIWFPPGIYCAEWRDPEAACSAMLSLGVLTQIAVIARDRRHRRNLALPITAITRDYGDLCDWTVRTPWSGMAEDTSSGSLHSAPEIF